MVGLRALIRQWNGWNLDGWAEWVLDFGQVREFLGRYLGFKMENRVKIGEENAIINCNPDFDHDQLLLDRDQI